MYVMSFGFVVYSRANHSADWLDDDTRSPQAKHCFGKGEQYVIQARSCI